MSSRLPVAVIGAGPVGLAAAAHLLAAGEEPLILELPATGVKGARGRTRPARRLPPPSPVVAEPLHSCSCGPRCGPDGVVVPPV